MSSENNLNGKISMNPKQLHKISSNGLELEQKVSGNYEKLNEVLENMIQSVKTPELNKQLENLYEIMKKVEENYNNNNKVVNDFFNKKIVEYNELAETVEEASSTLNQNAGFSEVTGSNGTANFEYDKVISSNDNVNLDVPTSTETPSVETTFETTIPNTDSDNLFAGDAGINIGNDNFTKSFGEGDGVIHLDPREKEGFGPTVDK